MSTMHQMFCALSPQERWRFLALRVRCGLHAEPAAAVNQLFAMGGWLCEAGEANAWDVARRTAALLLDTADDPALPASWREHCLQRAAQPLGVMRQISEQPDLPPHEATELRRQQNHAAHRLARLLRAGKVV